jgi:ATP-binding cassette subfamily B protein RaxB
MQAGPFTLTGRRRLPVLLQAEAPECALACIAMIASYYGDGTDLSALRREHRASAKGTSLKELVRIASDLGLGSRALRCEMADLRNLRVPAILHWNLDHYVVLERVKRDGVIIHDPAIGRVFVRSTEVSRAFTGVAVELSPTPEFRPRRTRSAMKLSSIVSFDRLSSQTLAQGAILSVLLQAFVLIAPVFMQLVIDESIQRSDTSLLLVVTLGFGLLKTFEVATTLLRGFVFQFLASIMSFDLKTRLFHQLVRLPLSYFHNRHVGGIQSRFQALQPITDFVVNGALAAFIDGLLGLSVAILLVIYSPMLAGIALLGVFLYLAARWAFIEIAKNLSSTLVNAQARESSTFLETLRAIQSIKASTSEADREAMWRNVVALAVSASMKSGNVAIVYQALNIGIVGLSTIVVVYLGAMQVIANEMSTGMLVAFLAYKGQLEQRLLAFIEQLTKWRMLDVQLELVADIAHEPREAAIDLPATQHRLAGRVAAKNLAFRFAPQDSDVFANLSFEISPGEFVAIVGPSGIGKSTLLRVLSGLYTPTSGEVLFDGIPLNSLGPRTIREQVGFVLQDDTLLAGSIADNIAMFADRVELDRVQQAARTACIHDDIMRLPMGYRTLVGDMGAALSSGQQQRVLIARALYRRPAILMLDEGTSNLDVDTERRLNASLRDLRITRVIVAHRPESIRAADRQISLEVLRPLPERGFSLEPTP